MAFQRAASLKDLRPGSVREAIIGEQPIALCHAGGQIHALAGICPHRGGPLGQGTLNQTTLTCPWHAWQFDCVTGNNDFDASIQLRKFPVQVHGDDILVDLG